MSATRKPYAAEFDGALELWHSGDPEAAITQLQDLAVRYPNEAAIHGMLGGYLYDHGGLLEAEPHARAAVRLSPRSQLAARTLFHVLHDLGRLTDAIEELKRFRSATESDELRREWSRLVRAVEAELGER